MFFRFQYQALADISCYPICTSCNPFYLWGGLNQWAKRSTICRILVIKVESQSSLCLYHLNHLAFFPRGSPGEVSYGSNFISKHLQGRLEEARGRLSEAIRLEPAFKQMALEDEDLQAIW